MMEQSEYSRNLMDTIDALGEHHVACVLLVDTSGSMVDDPLNNLLEGLKTFRSQSLNDPLSSKRIDIAIVEFNSEANIVQPFVPVRQMEIPHLEATGGTQMSRGLNLALDLIDERKALYQAVGTPYFRPWVYIITDGYPNDDLTMVAARIHEMEKNKKVMCWACGVPGYNPKPLLKLTERVKELTDLNFTTLFEYLSNSLIELANSDPSGELELNPLPENMRIVPKIWTKK